jgi:hypothetical protein
MTCGGHGVNSVHVVFIYAEDLIAFDDNTLSQVFFPQFVPVIGIKFLLSLKYGNGSFT